MLGSTFSSPAQSFQQSSTPSLPPTTTPAPTVTSTTAATTTEARVTTSPAPATRQPRVLPPETRPPRVVPPQLVPASRQPRVLAEREREGRAGHSSSSGYSAPASPAYHPPVHGKKPAGKYAKILKLTGLDTAPVPEFDFMFSTENKINVMAAGELRNVCSQDVTVMRGSYDYWGPDGVQYTVDWYADETGNKYFHHHGTPTPLSSLFAAGFHPSAAHLPKPVEPNHPEVAAAVAAQLEAAAHHHYRQVTVLLTPRQCITYHHRSSAASATPAPATRRRPPARPSPATSPRTSRHHRATVCDYNLSRAVETRSIIFIYLMFLILIKRILDWT